MFAYYPMDNPVPVSGTIHVGIIQQDIDRLNIGLDKTTNSNAGNLHYMLGPGFNWTLSGIEGSLMIRPVLRAGTDLVEDIGDNDVPSTSLISNPYPNPTSYSLSFNCSRNLDWNIFDINGKLIESGQESKGSSTLDVRHLTNGVYILRASISNGEGVEHHRFVIQH